MSTVNKPGKIVSNAKTGKKNSIFPKVIFKADRLDDSIIIENELQLEDIPDDSYTLAEPLSTGWGTDYDILIGRNSEGTFIISFGGGQRVPTTTTSPTTTDAPSSTTTTTLKPTPPVVVFVPFQTNTGSFLDYSYRFEGIFQPSSSTIENVKTFPGMTHRNGWYNSAVPVPGTDYFLFGSEKVKGININTGEYWTADDLLGSSFYIANAIVDSTGVVFVFGSTNIIKISPSGQILFNLPKAQVTEIPSPYTDIEYLQNTDIINKPDGDFYIIEDFRYKYVENITYNGTVYPINKYGPNETSSYSLSNGELVYKGVIKGIPEGKQIDQGGMISDLNWKFIPGTNEMYYSHYNSTARIDCSTDTVVWWIDRPNDGDELTAVLPNKNIIMASVNDDADYILAEYSYADGSLVRSVLFEGTEIGLDIHPEAATGLLGLNLAPDNKVYLTIESRHSSVPKKGHFVVVDLATFTVERTVDFLGDGTTTAHGRTTQVPTYYGYSIMDAGSNLWFWYDNYYPADSTSGSPYRYATTFVGGIGCFTGTEVKYFPLINENIPDTICRNDGFSISGDRLYFMTSDTLKAINITQ
jgi:hypothetical protein